MTIDDIRSRSLALTREIREAERRLDVATRIARLMVTSESVQAREKATAPKPTQQKPQEPIEQQSILPGFEATFAGG